MVESPSFYLYAEKNENSSKITIFQLFFRESLIFCKRSKSRLVWRILKMSQICLIWVSIDSEFHGISFDMRLDILSTEWSQKIPTSYLWLLKSQSASFFLSIHMRNTLSFWRNFGISDRSCVHPRLCLCPLVHGCCQFGLRLFGWSVSRLDAWVQTMISQAPIEMREKETVKENDL